jgi:hypothetical protein
MGDRLDRPGMIYQDRQTTSADYAFAYATGGRAFYSSSDLKKGFEEAARTRMIIMCSAITFPRTPKQSLGGGRSQ